MHIRHRYWYYIDGWTIDAIPDDLLQTQPDFVQVCPHTTGTTNANVTAHCLFVPAQTVDKLELWAQWDSDPWLNQLEVQ